MKKIILIVIIFLGIVRVNAQECVSDTMLVWTDKTPFVVSKHYVIKGNYEMVVSANNEKNDTTLYNDICAYTIEQYEDMIRILKLRKKPINKVYADEVFDYFPSRATKEEVAFLLRSKKIYATPRGYKVSFFNKFHKKYEFIEFRFMDGRLSSIERTSHNTFPTNDVQEAFRFLKMKDNFSSEKKIK